MAQSSIYEVRMAPMDIMKYRKWVLEQNWGSNRFQMVKYNVDEDVRWNRVFDTPYGRCHPLVLSGKAYWVNKRELCIGYKLDTNPEIYRPIFSHKRQRLIDEMTKDIIKPKFWNKVKAKYFNYLYKMKVEINEKESIILPILCIENIINFTISPLTFDYIGWKRALRVRAISLPDNSSEKVVYGRE